MHVPEGEKTLPGPFVSLMTDMCEAHELPLIYFWGKFLFVFHFSSRYKLSRCRHSPGVRSSFFSLSYI